jgi:hypothetical protein
LTAASKIPAAQLGVLQASGAKVAAGQAQLVALSKVPAADLAYVSKYASLNEPKVQKLLTDVSNAKAKSPKQWQHYFWIAVGGEVVFIPLIFLLTGFWSPKKAREKEEEHERWVEAELAKLSAS